MGKTSCCRHCGAEASFERIEWSMPPEGEICSHCGDWVCPDCIDWALMSYLNTLEPICKKCYKFFK